MILDVRTINIFSACTPLVLALMLSVYWRERKVYGGFGRWIMANFGLSLGYAFGTLAGLVSPFLTIFLSNCIIVYCMILIYEGIEEFYDRPRFHPENYLIWGVYSLLQFFFTFVRNSENTRVLCSSAAVCILVLLAGRRLLIVPIAGLVRTSRAAGHVFFATAIFPFLVAITSINNSPRMHILSDVLNSWFSVVFIISIVMWTFYFFFLNSARLELDLETARAELDVVARTDPLTNLYNRRHFDEQSVLEFDRSRRSGYSSSILLLDVDEFKSINDDYGHDVGDAVLISIAAVLRSELRSFDVIARYGGDEFIIMLTNTSSSEAFFIAERIRERISLIPFAVPQRIFNVTLSIGIGTLVAADTDLRSLLKRSDDALYRAKEQGRNCVVAA